MAIEGPVPDTSRAIQHNPDQSWPATLGIYAKWPNGMVSYIPISADEFFGRGRSGAPLPGDAIVGMIRNMVAGGEPARETPKTGPKNGKASRGAKSRTVVARKGATLRGKRKGPSK